MTTCLRHRDLFGSRWQSGTPICTIPDEIAAHKSSSVKGLCCLRSNQSAYVYFTLSQLVPTGSHKPHGTVGSRPANDPSTANDPQIGPQTIPRQEMIPRDCTANDGIFDANQSCPMKEMSRTQEFGQGIYFNHFFS